MSATESEVVVRREERLFHFPLYFNASGESQPSRGLMSTEKERRHFALIKYDITFKLAQVM